MIRKAGQTGLTYFLIMLFVLFTAFPFYWMLITTFKNDNELYRNREGNPLVFNQTPTLDNLRLLLNNTNYRTFVENSLKVGVAVVVITVLLAVPASYSLARLAGVWGSV